MTTPALDPVSAPSSDIDVTMDPAQARWDEYVAKAPGSSVYHLWCWREVFEQVFGQRAHYLAALRKDRVVGILPLVEFRSRLFGRFAVSLPFLNYGGVVADDETVRRRLVEAASQLAREHGLTHVELRHETRQCPDLQVKEHKVAMRLALPSSPDVLWNGIDRKARNQVRKAQKCGLTSVAGGAELLDGFYGVFAENMRDLGTPVYPLSLFEVVARLLPDRVRVHQVRLGDQVVAGAVTIAWRSTVEVPWASSLQRHRDKSPNNLLYWSMLEHAIGEGMRTFDFGRSTPGEGTFHFKQQWGAVASPFHWEYWLAAGRTLPDQSPKNPKFMAAIAAWRRLPLWVANRLGPAIVRDIP